MHPGEKNYRNQVIAGSESSRVNLLVLTTSIAFALVVSLFILVLGSILLYFTPVLESYAPVMVFAANLVGIVLGSRKVGMRVGVKGWLNGGLVGLGYMIIIIVIGQFVLEPQVLGSNLISTIFLGFVFGALGGMWGVNS